MKNVEPIPVPRIPTYRVKIAGAQPLHGWAVQYVSGMEEEPEIRPGYWLSTWRIDKTGAIFAFDLQLVLCYGTEKEAAAISDFLRRVTHIETQVVQV